MSDGVVAVVDSMFSTLMTQGLILAAVGSLAVGVVLVEQRGYLDSALGGDGRQGQYQQGQQQYDQQGQSQYDQQGQEQPQKADYEQPRGESQSDQPADSQESRDNHGTDADNTER